jgi:predicted acylesterase/phospholipase RssA
MRKLVIGLGVGCIIGSIGYYVGTNSPWRDLSCLILSLGLTAVLLRVCSRTVSRIRARRDRGHITHNVRRDLLVAAMYLCVTWALLSLSDFLFERRPIVLDNRTTAPNPSDTMPRIGLALSGGGYRAALFHAGLLAELETIGVRPSVLSTVSGGSIIGAFYAQGGRPEVFLNALIQGRFNLERRLLRVDNVFRFASSTLSFLMARLIGWHRSPSSVPFTTTLAQAQMLDDLFLHGVFVKDTRNATVPQMICTTDIANSEILCMTSRGSLIRSIDDSLARTQFANPARKASNVTMFETDQVIGLPGQTRLSVLVAASGAFPVALPPIAVKRWTITDGFDGAGLLADGGLGDNSGLSQLDAMQYLSYAPSNPDNDPGAEWRIPVFFVSDASALVGKFSSSGYLSDVSRSIDIIYKAVGGPPLFSERRPAALPTGKLDDHSGALVPHQPRLVFLSPHTVARRERELTPDRTPSALSGYEKENGYPTIVFGKQLEISTAQMTPLNIDLIPEEVWRGLATAMPPSTGHHAMSLIDKIISSHSPTQNSFMAQSGTSPNTTGELTGDQRELINLFVSDLDHCLAQFMKASTLKDHYEQDEAEAIFRLGRYVVRLNQPFINCEIGRSGCITVIR